MKEVIITFITVIGGIVVAIINNKRKEAKLKKEAKTVNKIEDAIIEDVEIIESYPMLNIYTNKDVVIFLLDDNIDDTEVVERVIKKMGEKSKTFTEKDEYLMAIPSTANVHIIDHYLSLGYGWEILLELKRRNKLNFVILYSGTKDKKTVEEYKPYKIDEVIYKDDPDNLILLERVIRKGLISIRG